MEKQLIIDAYEEMKELERIGHCSMMLNTETKDIWVDFFVSEGDYKIYKNHRIIEIPINDIIYKGTKDHALTKKK